MSELPSGWEYRRVDQVGDVQLGRQRSPAMMVGPYLRPYLRVANVLDGYIDYSDVYEMNFTPTEAQIFGLQRGDILLNEGQDYALVGRCAVFDGSPGMCFQNTLLRFRPHSVLPKFAAAVFKHWVDHGEFRKLTRQTTSIAHIGTGQFSAMQFPVASIKEQRQIAKTLADADNLIRRTLRAIEKSSLLRGAMSASLVEGAEIRLTLADVLSMSPTNGLYKPASDYADGGVPIVRIDSIHGGEIEDFSTLRRVVLTVAERNAFGIQRSDILVNRVNSIDFVGKSAIVRTIPEPTVFESNIMRCRIREDLARPQYIALWLGAPRTMAYFRSCAKSAIGQASINQRDVGSCPIPLPSLADQDRVISYFDHVRNQDAVQRAELAKLRLLKQGLMDDLLSGRVRVPSI